MRPALPLLAFALSASAVGAQVPDSTATPDSIRAAPAEALRTVPLGARRVTTVPLPNDRGVFYYRAGTPGGVRIRSRRTRPVEAAPAVPSAAAPLPTERTRAQALAGGPTRLDLALLEERLLRAIDQRLAALDPGYRPPSVIPGSPPAPVLVLPAAPGAAPTPAAPVPAPTAEPPAEPGVSPAPAAPPNPLIQEIERAILDTGLFRTTRVPFEFGKASLLPVAEETVRAVATVLRRYARLRVEVGGHTDWVGSEAFNLRLSQERAEAVRGFLVASGVDAGRVTAVGYGEGRPVASNETDTGRALNRRVEFTVLNPDAAERERRTVREADPDEATDLRQLIQDELERMREDDGS